MNLRYFLLILMLAVGVCAAEADCGYCHGGGRVRAWVGVSGYGVSNRKKFCSQCNGNFDATTDHWHTCPRCHGNPGGPGRRPNDNTQGMDMFMRYLTPDEYRNFQMLVQQSMQGVPESVQCQDCGGSGRCRPCGGSGLSPLQSYDPTWGSSMNPCPRCRGGRNCTACGGLGSVTVYTQNHKAEIQRMIEHYRDIATQRQRAQGGR